MSPSKGFASVGATENLTSEAVPNAGMSMVLLEKMAMIFIAGCCFHETLKAPPQSQPPQDHEALLRDYESL